MIQANSQPIRVMLVDDHRSVLWGLERLIEGEKPRMQVVGTATSQADALATIAQTAPDVILLDLDLGGESGVNAIPDFLAKSKARVLILTGVRDPAKHDSAVLAGACGVVTKEDTAETILKAIEKAYHGELWLDRAATGRIFVELSRRNSTDKKDPHQQDREKFERLTERERDVLRLTAQGYSAPEIGEKLFISPKTVDTYKQRINEKLGLSHRADYVQLALRLGLLARD